MCGSSCLENTVPTEFIWAQPSQNPTRNDKMWPITMCPLPSIFATLEMHQRGKEAARAQTGNWTRYKQRQYRTAKWTEQSICSFWNILKFTSATLSRPLSRPLSRVHRPEAVKTFLNVTSGNLQCMASTFTHTHIQPASSTGQSPHVLQDSNRVTGSMMAVCCKISQCRSKCGQSVLAIMDCHCWIHVEAFTVKVNSWLKAKQSGRAVNNT